MTFKKARCQLCGQEKHLTQVFPVAMLPTGLKAAAKTPLLEDGYVCLKDMHGLQAHYIQTVLGEAHALFHALNPEATTPKDQADVSATTLLQPPVEAPLTFGERVSDRIADFGGSWPFIGVFTGIIVVWITLNSWAIFRVGFDPYPYILLNLLLSCLAAIQAPIIMMSQNRQEKKTAPNPSTIIWSI